jgi:hypothetical protein
MKKMFRANVVEEIKKQIFSSGTFSSLENRAIFKLCGTSLSNQAGQSS